jgi:hypothetical protein
MATLDYCRVSEDAECSSFRVTLFAGTMMWICIGPLSTEESATGLEMETLSLGKFGISAYDGALYISHGLRPDSLPRRLEMCNPFAANLHPETELANVL